MQTEDQKTPELRIGPYVPPVAPTPPLPLVEMPTIEIRYYLEVPIKTQPEIEYVEYVEEVVPGQLLKMVTVMSGGLLVFVSLASCAIYKAVTWVL